MRRDSHHGLFSSHIISIRLQIPEIQDFGVLLRRCIFYLPHLQTWTPSSLLGFPQKLFPAAWHPPSTPRRRTSKAIAAQRPIALIRKSEVQRFFPLQVKVFPGFSRFFQVQIVDSQIWLTTKLRWMDKSSRYWATFWGQKSCKIRSLTCELLQQLQAPSFSGPRKTRSKPSTAWWRIAEYVESRLKDQIDPPGHTDSHHH